MLIIVKLSILILKIDNAWERPTSNYEIPILKDLIYKIALFIN